MVKPDAINAILTQGFALWPNLHIALFFLCASPKMGCEAYFYIKNS